MKLSDRSREAFGQLSSGKKRARQVFKQSKKFLNLSPSLVFQGLQNPCGRPNQIRIIDHQHPKTIKNKRHNTFSDGCLGSHNDEERSEMRYVMRIAESSESSKL
eukprot:gene42148-57073_t